MRDGRLVGIVSRANLIQALAAAGAAPPAVHDSDRHIRDTLLARLDQETWTDFGSRNVTVRHGIVHLWGMIGSEAERQALIALAAEVPGVTQVVDEMFATYDDTGDETDDETDEDSF